MKKSVLTYLTCLTCAGELQISETIAVAMGDEEQEILEGTISCTECGETYPVRRGVPRLVSAERSHPVDVYTGVRFCESWGRFSRMDERYFSQFFDWLAPVKPCFVQGKVVLEGGCGKGRHSLAVMQAGASEVVAVDIGDSVDLAFSNVGSKPGIHVVQADLMNLPLKRKFDYAFSVGVLHHMRQPERGFTSLASKVKVDGAISTWVYGRENNGWLVNLVNPFRTVFTSRSPSWVVGVISHVFAVIVFLTAKFFAGPWATLRRKYEVLPQLFYECYLTYIGKFDYFEINSIVFDHLTAPVAYYLTKDDVLNWYVNQGLLEPVLRWHNQNSWAAFSPLSKAPCTPTIAENDSASEHLAVFDRHCSNLSKA